jgi:hypothetical protein
MVLDQEVSRRAKDARKLINSLLETYYQYWVDHFQADNEQFFQAVLRAAEANTRAFLNPTL